MGDQDSILRWVDERTRALLARPRMWGSDEAVEMQVLLLLQVRLLILHPNVDPSSLVDRYLDHIAGIYPQQGRRPLSQFIESDRLGANLTHELAKIIEALVAEDGSQNPSPTV